MPEHRSIVVNDMLRILIAHICIVEKRTHFSISRSFIDAAPFNDVEVDWKLDINNNYIFTLKDRRKKQLSDGIQEAEFEIIETKQLDGAANGRTEK